MISVIIPVYNLENYITDCLNSVISQTYTNLEIILINDGSADNSDQICRKFAEKDKRVQLISQENRGLSAARNTGLKAATGDYIAFVDGDDILHRDYFKTLIECAEKYDADIAVLKYVFINSKEELDSMNDLFSEKTELLTAKEAVLRIERDSRRYMITAWGKLFRADHREQLYFPKGKFHEDEFVTYKALYNAEKVVVSDCRYYGYLKRGGSIMGRFSKRRMEDGLEAMREAITFFKKQNDSELFRYAIRRYLFRIAIDYYRVCRELPDDRELKKETKKLFDEEYKKMYPHVKKGTSVIYASAFKILEFSPGLYLKFCDIFLKYLKED